MFNMKQTENFVFKRPKEFIYGNEPWHIFQNDHYMKPLNIENTNHSYPRQWPLLSRIGLLTNGQGAEEGEYGVEEDGEEETDEEEMGPAHPRGYLLWLLQ